MFIFIEVEIFKREFLGKLLMSRAIINNDNKVIISDRSSIKNLILNNKISDSVLITKDINPRKDLLEYYIFLKSKNFTIISQDEEAGILPDDYSMFSSLRHGNGEVIEIIDYLLCWGERDFNFFKNKFKKFSHKFIDFGSPKIDIMNNEFKVDNNFLVQNKINKKFILLSFNFMPFYYRPFIERISLESDRLKEKFINFSKIIFYRESEALKIMYDFIKLADYLEKNQNEYEIVIRPHPNFDIEDFSKIMKNINKKVKVCNEGNLIEFTKNCSSLIYNTCSASLDGSIIGKQIIAFKTKDKEYFKSDFLNSLGFNCEQEEEVLSLIKSKKIKPKSESLAERLNFNSSIPKIRKIIKSLSKNSKKLNINFNKKNIKTLLNIFRLKYLNNKNQINYTDLKYKGFDNLNIQRSINLVNNYNYEEFNHKIKYKLESKNIILIEKY